MRGTRGSLMKYVVDNKLPLDFFSFHKYTNHTNDPHEFKRMAEDFSAELAKYELGNVPIVNSEFWTSLVGEQVIGGEAGQAAFLAQSLIYQQSVVAKSMHYGRVGSGQSKLNEAFSQISKMNTTPRKLCHKTQAGEDNGFAVMAGRGESDHKLQVAIASYHVPENLMGPSVLEEDITVTIMSYLPRRTIMYPNTKGYELTINNIPDSWGDVTVETFRVDAAEHEYDDEHEDGKSERTNAGQPDSARRRLERDSRCGTRGRPRSRHGSVKLKTFCGMGYESNDVVAMCSPASCCRTPQSTPGVRCSLHLWWPCRALMVGSRLPVRCRRRSRTSRRASRASRPRTAGAPGCPEPRAPRCS